MKAPQVFISYRRKTGGELSLLIYKALVERGYRVFRDVDDLKAGPFDTALFRIISECSDVVVVLTPQSLDRCHDEEDWMRMEVAHALRSGKTVIPVFHKEFATPTEALPKDIKALLDQHGLTPDQILFEESMNKLAKMLKARPARWTKWRHAGLAAVVVICAALTGAMAWSLLSGRSHELPTALNREATEQPADSEGIRGTVDANPVENAVPPAEITQDSMRAESETEGSTREADEEASSRAVTEERLPTIEIKATVETGERSPYILSFSHDGGTLLCATIPATTAKVVDLADNYGITSITPPWNMALVSLSPDGKIVAANKWQERGAFILYDTQTGEVRGTFQVTDAGIRNARFTADSRTLVVQSESDVYSCDLDSLKPTKMFTLQERPFSFAMTPDGQTVMTGTSPNLLLYDAKSGLQKRRFTGTAGISLGGEFCMKGKAILVTSNAGHTVWDLTTDKEIAKIAFDQKRHLYYSVALDEPVFAREEKDGPVELISLATGEPYAQTARLPGGIVRVELSPNGKVLAAAFSNGKVLLWDVPALAASTSSPRPEQIPPATDQRTPGPVATAPATVVTSEAMANDGIQLLGTIAFVRDKDIHVCDLRTRAIQRLTNDAGDDIHDPHWSGTPRFSPDGTAIAFLCRQGKTISLCIMDPDGGNRRSIMAVDSPRCIDDISWAPDGKRIVFISNEAKTVASQGWDVFTAEADGSDKKILVEDARWPDWSPGGKEICVIKFNSDKDGNTVSWNILIVDVDGTTIRNLGMHPGSPTGPREPRWSPDGTKIAYVTLDSRHHRIHVMDSTGENRKELAEGVCPEWSPDGTKLAFCTLSEVLHVMDVDGRNPTEFITKAYSPSWVACLPSAEARRPGGRN